MKYAIIVAKVFANLLRRIIVLKKDKHLRMMGTISLRHISGDGLNVLIARHSFLSLVSVDRRNGKDAKAMHGRQVRV